MCLQLEAPKHSAPKWILLYCWVYQSVDCKTAKIAVKPRSNSYSLPILGVWDVGLMPSVVADVFPPPESYMKVHQQSIQHLTLLVLD
jgi:hypothetical protein